jgi:hypothetical protein
MVRGRGNGYVREATPLFNSPLVLATFDRERGKRF